MTNNALITGGFGFLGKNLTQRLLDLNFNVTLLGSPKGKVENYNQQVSIINERIEKSNLDDLVKDKDYIFHLAWQTDLEESMKNPTLDISRDIVGLLNILESCKKNNPNIKIIFPSAVTVIGLGNKLFSNEDEKENPLSIYDANKLMAEKYLSVYFKNYGIKFTSLRLSNIFGESQKIDNAKRGILNFMIGKSLRNEPLTVHGDGSFIRDYSYVQNIIDSFVIAAQSPITDGETYVIGSGEGKSFKEVVTKIQEYAKEIYKSKSEIIYIPFPEDSNAINKRNFIADSSKFKKATGWSPRVSFEDGLKKTMDFYKNE